MEFKDRVANKPNRVKLTYEDSGVSAYATVELADEPIEEGTPLNKNTFDAFKREVESFVGSVVVTSSNLSPSSVYGGEWRLIDKGFAASATNETDQFIPTEWTDGSDYITCTGCSTVRSGSTCRIRLTLQIKELALGDDEQILGNFDLSKVGIIQLPMGFTTVITANDGANAALVWELSYNGQLRQIDVLNKTSISGNHSWTFDIMFNVTTSQMLDEFCDKFYWKRIA